MLYIFDMGDVTAYSGNTVERIAKVLGITVEQFNEYSGALSDMLSDGEIDSMEFWEAFSQKSGIEVNTDWWHWMLHPKRNEKVYQIIERLRKEGHRVVCGTNTIDSHYMVHVERGDYAVFDQVYSSCFMGVSKPDVAFYNLIMTAEDVKPADCIFIDDSQKNCDAASSLGIKSIHFTSAEELEKEIFC